MPKKQWRTVSALAERAAMVLYGDTGEPSPAELGRVRYQLERLAFVSTMHGLWRRGTVPAGESAGVTWYTEYRRLYAEIEAFLDRMEADGADAPVEST